MAVGRSVPRAPAAKLVLMHATRCRDCLCSLLAAPRHVNHLDVLLERRAPTIADLNHVAAHGGVDRKRHLALSVRAAAASGTWLVVQADLVHGRDPNSNFFRFYGKDGTAILASVASRRKAEHDERRGDGVDKCIGESRTEP